MTKFFEELAKTLAERWLSLLVIPGLVVLCAAWVAAGLGHRHALDIDLLRQQIDNAVATYSQASVGTLGLHTAALLLLSTVLGMAVQALAGTTRKLWLGEWPRIFTPINQFQLRQRRRRWAKWYGERAALERREEKTPTQQVQREINEAAHRANRIAYTEPNRPTWMGDRVSALQTFVLNRYGFDLEFGWPRLWMTMPDSARSEIRDATGAFAAAVAVGTWAWPCLLVGFFWWPALVIAACVWSAGVARGRSAIDELTTLSEAAIDLNSRALAIALGVGDVNGRGPINTDEGRQIRSITRKGR